MVTIHGVLRSRAMRNAWLCEEIGLPWRHVPVIQAYRLADPSAPDAPFNTASPAFRQISPAGLVPVMEDDGLVLTESLAINLYLARKYGGALGPADIAEEGLFAQWTLWAATEVEPRSIQILQNRVQLPPDRRDEHKAEAAIAALRAPFALLDAALAATGHPVGGRFTVADINIAEVVRYAMTAPDLFAAAPRVAAWLAACHARPAWKALAARREAEPA